MTIKSVNSQESKGAFGWIIHDVTSHPLPPYNVLLIIEYKTSDKNMFVVYVCIVCKKRMLKCATFDRICQFTCQHLVLICYTVIYILIKLKFIS